MVAARFQKENFIVMGNRRLWVFKSLVSSFRKVKRDAFKVDLILHDFPFEHLYPLELKQAFQPNPC